MIRNDFNHDWLFAEAAPGAPRPEPSAFVPVDLPHDWQIAMPAICTVTAPAIM